MRAARAAKNSMMMFFAAIKTAQNNVQWVEDVDPLGLLNAKMGVELIDLSGCACVAPHY